MTVRVTTSWDDGHILDMRVADLLDQYGLRGTFYIAREYVDQRLSGSDLRELAGRHEIGAHTLTHPILTAVSLEQAQSEIAGSKTWLEDILGQSVTAFCYPRGAQNPALQRIVKEAGYTMARTVDGFALNTGNNPYAIPTTLQVYPYPMRPLAGISWLRGWSARLKPVREALPHIRTMHFSPLALLKWPALAQSLLEQAARQDGTWHLWGHSWEIERYGLWDALTHILSMIQQTGAFVAVTNGELVSQG